MYELGDHWRNASPKLTCCLKHRICQNLRVFQILSYQLNFIFKDSPTHIGIFRLNIWDSLKPVLGFLEKNLQDVLSFCVLQNLGREIV